MKTNQIQISVRFPEDLYAELQAFAQDTERTVNGAVNWLLRLGLKAENLATTQSLRAARAARRP